jgi:hypothetical protein
MEKWYRHKDQLRRQFTVMAIKNSEVLRLSLDSLNRMRTEFPEQYFRLLEGSLIRMRKFLIMKRKAIKICEEKLEVLSRSSSMDSSDYQRTGLDMSESQDLSNKVQISRSENIELLKDEIDYGLKAADLCAIDEEDIEDSSKSFK